MLNTADTDLKAAYTLRALDLWHSGALPKDNVGTGVAPDRPARPEHVELLPPHLAPKRGKGGSLANRIAMVHSLVHIESMAVDLSWDIMVRFQKMVDLPAEFYADWLKIAADEAKHYGLLKKRLEELGSHYGALPAHDSLWESAQKTSGSLLSRLCIEHMVHEARGLDQMPTTVARFRSGGDPVTADLLEVILEDEITHVTAGMKWFTYLCQHSDPPLDPIPTFHQVVRENFRGGLKPPFNTRAREKAGMTEEWYVPLVLPKPAKGEEEQKTPHQEQQA